MRLLQLPRSADNKKIPLSEKGGELAPFLD